MEEDVSQSGISSAKHTQFPWAHMCLRTVPMGAGADCTVAEVSQENGSLFRAGRPSMRNKEEAGAIPRLCSWTSSKWKISSGHCSSSRLSPVRSAFSGSRQDPQGGCSMVPKGWQSRKAVLTQGGSSAASHLWNPLAQEPTPKLFPYTN